MKKTLAILLVALLAVGSMCFASAETTYKVGVSIYQFTDNFMTLYAEENTDYCFEELIRGVLEAADVEYWIISPMRTYRI